MELSGARLHHIALTVTDVDASVAWYEKVFQIPHVADVPHEGGVGKLLRGDVLGIVLHHHETNDGERFAETKTGLDHVGFNVGTRDDLVRWQAHLAELGVERVEVADRPLTQSPIADDWYGSVLVFRDPDNIQLELFSPPVDRPDSEG